jgi:drug/metabolite transporter (DMT)-like permease
MPEFGSWFVYSLISVILYGGIDFMYKAAAHYNCSAARILNISAISVALLSLAFVFATNSRFVNTKFLILFAVINSSFFAVGSIAKIKALKRIPSSYAFPITKLNSVFLVLYSLILFNDNPTAMQWIGIVISLSIPIYLGFSMKKNSEKSGNFEFGGLLFAIGAALSTSVSMLTGKYASESVPKINYMFVSYSLVVIYTFLINKLRPEQKEKTPFKFSDKTFLFGTGIGILNFAGYYFVLMAFSSGPLSLIQGVASNSFVISVLLSVIIFKEKFTLKNAIIVALALISIVFIKFI